MSEYRKAAGIKLMASRSDDSIRKQRNIKLIALFFVLLSVFISNLALANEVVNFMLVNAATDQDIRPLVNGDVVRIWP